MTAKTYTAPQMHILYVGDKLSNKCRFPNLPFIGTHSLRKLEYWARYLGAIHFNVCNKDNIAAIKAHTGPVVALGVAATVVLVKHGIAHYSLPHPSPKNRILNDKALERRLLNKFRIAMLEKYGNIVLPMGTAREQFNKEDI